MSQSLSYTGCDVEVSFKSIDEMNKQVSAFEKDVEAYDNKCRETDYDYGNPTRAFVIREDDKLKAYIKVDDDGESFLDDQMVVEFICKHFPTACGSVGWANVDLRHGVCTFACGGNTDIKDGKVVPSPADKLLKAEKKIKELQYALNEALDYIGMVVSNGDITECGVAHLFKKYMPDEYKEALKEKEEK